MRRPCLQLAIGIGQLAIATLSVLAQTTTPATLPASPKVGDELPLNDLLYLVAQRYRAIIVQPTPIDAKITLTESLPEKAADLPAALSRLLAPAGYNALRSKSNTDRLVLRILTGDEARKLLLAEGPVTSGTDFAAIDTSDRTRLVTHVLPMTKGDLATAARNLASEDKEIQIATAGDPKEPAGVQFIITGPADHVRKAVETLVAVDRPAAAPLIRTRRMQNLGAEAAADVLLRQFGQGPPDQALKALADAPTNTVVLSGPDLVVLQALILLEQLDREAPKPTLAIPRDYRTPSLPQLQPPPAAPEPAPAPSH